jgi:hypothetical protein
MANVCSSSLSVGSFKDTEKFIKAVRDGFNLDGKLYEHPFTDLATEDAFDLVDGKYPSTIYGDTRWALDPDYMVALSKHLDTPVGCTNQEDGLDVLCAQIAKGDKVLEKSIDRDSYLKKHNLQDSEDLYAEDNYDKFAMDLDEALDEALEALFKQIS